MQFSIIYKKRAVELYDGHTAEGVFKQLLEEFPDIYHPNEKTLIRWRKDIQLQEHNERQQEVKKEPDPVIKQLSHEHRDQLVKVAEAILGSFASLTYNKEAQKFSDFSKSRKYKEALIATPKIRMEVVKGLLKNIKNAQYEYQYLNLYDYFMVHLKEEYPVCTDLCQYAKASPEEFIKLFKMLVLKKDFKGECPACAD